MLIIIILSDQNRVKKVLIRD